MLNTHLYQKNMAILTRYGDNGKYKVAVCKAIRTPGIELTDKEKERRFNRGKINDAKLENSISRTKSLVLQYAMCNSWDFFITLTLDPKKYDRHNLKKFIKDLGQFIQDYKKKYKVDFAYLILPEPHEDGAWHCHGLVRGIPLEHLRLFTLQDKLPYKVLASIEKGEKIYSWNLYAEKFGYCTLSAIKSYERISSYITKYISKDLSCRKSELNANLFYKSNGLQKAVELKRGHLNTEITYDFKNDYCSIAWFDKNIPSVYIEELID